VGTSVDISYTFEGAEVMFPCCCLAPLTPAAIRYVLVRSLQGVWTDLMFDRGYSDRYEAMATRLQAWTKGMAERRAHRRTMKEREKASRGLEDDEEDEQERKSTFARAAGAKQAKMPVPAPEPVPQPPKPAPAKAKSAAALLDDKSSYSEGKNASEPLLPKTKVIDDDSDDELIKMDTSVAPTGTGHAPGNGCAPAASTRPTRPVRPQ